MTGDRPPGIGAGGWLFVIALTVVIVAATMWIIDHVLLPA